MKNRSAFFYIIIVLALAAVAGLVLALAPGSQPDIPAVLLPTPAVTDPIPDDLDDPVSEGLVTVTRENVQVVIDTLHRIDSYARTLSVQDYWSGGSRSRSIDVWAHGDALRLTSTVEGGVTEHLLLRNGEKQIWYADAEGVYTGPAEAGDADAYQTILTYEKVLDLPARDILDAGYQDFGGRYCIYVRCRTGTMGYVSECWIDPGTGLLMGERCYDGETLIYAMDSSVPDETTPDDSVFLGP